MKYIVMFFIVLISSLAIAQSNEVFFLFVTIHRDDNVDLENFRINIGNPNVYSGQSGDYPIKIMSFDDEVLFESKLEIGFMTHRDIMNEDGSMTGEDVELESVSKFIRVPYFKDAKAIELYHDDKPIYIFDVSLNLCDKNSICEGYENNLNCPSDCSVEDDECDSIKDGVCDTDCAAGKDPDCVTCGNDICDKDESCGDCPEDCGECGTEVNCGNDICDADEDHKKCMQDCPSGSDDGYCDEKIDGKCDPDCGSGDDIDCASNKSYLGYYIIAIIIAGIVLFVGHRILQGNKNVDAPESNYTQDQ